MTAIRLTIVVFATTLLAGCGNEPPPRSVSEFMENPLLLEAALVRCTQNRSETRYAAECVNVREAVKLLEVREEAARKAELEEQSLRKREALRRTQAAAAEARRRSAENRRLREEAEYLAQFGELPPETVNETAAQTRNLPGAIIPPAENDGSTNDSGGSTAATYGDSAQTLPTAGSNAPVAETEPVEEEEAPADLESIRDELRRRNEADNQN